MAAVFLCHCGKKPYRYVDRFKAPQDDKAEAVLHILMAKNEPIKGVKGIGNVHWQIKDSQQTLRAAWVAQMPNRFRLALLGITGQPLVSLAGNGIWNYVRLHAEDRFIKRRSSKHDLEHFVAIELSTEDLVHLLCGRPPVKSGGTGWLEKDSAGDRQKLFYKEKASDFYYCIYFGDPKQGIQKIERISDTGAVMLCVSFYGGLSKDGYDLPKLIHVENGQEATLDLKMDRVWINPSVAADTFELVPYK